MEQASTIDLRIQDHIAYLTINRESKLNALNKQTLEDLQRIFLQVGDEAAVRGVILTGAGGKAFVAGADIAEFQQLDATAAMEVAHSVQLTVMNLIYDFHKPVVAAINGFALGGGLELAMACHLRVAATHAKMGLPEVSLGIIPGYGGTQRLTQLVGRGKALEMILTADMISAQEALSWGLVNHVVEAEALIAKAESILQQIFLRSPNAVSAAIKAVNAGLDPKKDGYEVEIAQFGQCFRHVDRQEGVQAFLEKRKPLF